MRIKALAYIALLSYSSVGNLWAHGIAGNRYFPATSTFDDPAVADDFSFNTFKSSSPTSVNSQVDSTLAVSGARLLTTNWALGFDYAKDSVTQSGLAQAYTKKDDIYIKTLFYRDDLNETLLSLSLGYGHAHTDLPYYGVSSKNSVMPALTFGKGMGNLDDGLSWLRPFALVGAIAADIPVQRSPSFDGTAIGNFDFVNNQAQNFNSVHWGFAIEYSTLFLTDRFHHGYLPKDEPLHQFVPLVEFAFDSSPSYKTEGTMNPGLTYVEQTWQWSGELIVPLHQGAYKVTGFRAQLMFFLDDLIPTFFEKPLLVN